ncbi:MAG: Xaa-Pro peptidase family protein [Candidatus Bathyarchaeota archaeon]|nr:Xaa-Pro peptidase family protein [Candidatus Bathyarchaeota archaeon]
MKDIKSSFTWDSGLGEAEYAKRLSRIKKTMKAQELDAIIIYASPNDFPASYIRYASNWGLRDTSLLIIPRTGEPELASAAVASYAYPFAKETSWIKRILPLKTSIGDMITNSLKSLQLRKGASLGVVGLHSMTHAEYDNVTKTMRHYQVQDATVLLDRLRLIKSPQEQRLLQKAAQLCDEAIEQFKKIAKPGISESRAFAEMEAYAATHGAEIHSFALNSGCTIASGPFVGIQPTSPRIRTYNTGDLVIVSSVFRYRGYWSQVIRTGYIGSFSGHGEKTFDIVADAQKEGIKALQPGKPLKLAYDAISYKLQEYCNAHEQHYHINMGHGIGLSYFEPPRLVFHSNRPDYNLIVKPGMSLMIHPSFLIEDLAIGAVHADHCLVTENGVDILTHSPEGLFTT